MRGLLRKRLRRMLARLAKSVTPQARVLADWDTPHFGGSTQTFYVVFVPARQKCGVSLVTSVWRKFSDTFKNLY
jgi:hypothetical protein